MNAKYIPLFVSTLKVLFAIDRRRSYVDTLTHRVQNVWSKMVQMSIVYGSVNVEFLWIVMCGGRHTCRPTRPFSGYIGIEMDICAESHPYSRVLRTIIACHIARRCGVRCLTSNHSYSVRNVQPIFRIVLNKHFNYTLALLLVGRRWCAAGHTVKWSLTLCVGWKVGGCCLMVEGGRLSRLNSITIQITQCDMCGGGAFSVLWRGWKVSICTHKKIKTQSMWFVKVKVRCCVCGSNGIDFTRCICVTLQCGSLRHLGFEYFNMWYKFKKNP